MAKNRNYFAFAGAAILLSITACGVPVEDASVELTPASTSAGLEVARFKLGEGRSARFVALGDGVLFEEMGPENVSPMVSTTDDLSAVDIFLALAPRETPVPKAIATLGNEAQREALSHRAVVETVSEPIDVAIGEGAIRILSHDGQTGTYNCSSGQAGFEAFACNGSGTSNEYCDSAAFPGIGRNSGDERVKRSLGVFVACGTHVEIKHQYRNCCGDWIDLYSTWIPGGYWMSSRWTGAAEWRRRLEYNRVYQPAGSYVRAYSAFY